MLTLVSELEVLIATAVWLHKNSWAIESISIAKGRGLSPIEQQKEQVRQELAIANVPLDDTMFKPRGPDIVARSEECIWNFECKGLGNGAPQTHKNSFDRAVASVVSYYDSPQIRLGLALAGDYLCVYNFADKLPQSLREAINLWVFSVENQEAYPYEPSDYLPYPGMND
ncbi:MAG: hypothetical protein V3U90_07020 [Dehalococcoidia bacterium]